MEYIKREGQGLGDWEYAGDTRLGHIHFINCLPLTYSLECAGFGRGMHITANAPSVLNRMVVAGELDITPVSSIIYAQHSEKLVLLPNLSISADGIVQSIILVSRKPVEELSGAKVALTAKSATSHGLLKIILQKAYQLQTTPEYCITTQNLETGAMDGVDATLLIGDDALNVYHHRTTDYFYYDLGAEWKRFTGHRMVYAVWVARRDFAARRPDLLKKAYELIAGGFAFGLANIRSAAEVLADRTAFSQGQILNYLNLINYGLTPSHCEALLTYYRLAAEIGLVDKVPELCFAEVNR
ncbi:MAG TPA: menaquinone biosynthesis protein [Patescibacteria group bacterium]|nr:menaquinone biosynthesis protein [Patescibacteria group bacterium]